MSGGIQRLSTNSPYIKPLGGIPSTDMTGTVQSTLAQFASPYAGKKLVACGTSITFNDWFLTPTLKPLGITSVVNLGNGGALLSTAPLAGGGTGNGDLSTEFSTGNIPADTDMIWIEAGINDFLNSATLGTIADTSKATSFYGALVQLAVWITTNRPRAQVYFIIPYGTAGTGGVPNYLTPNANANTMEQFQQAIKDVCQRYAFPFIDVGRGASVGGAYNAATLSTSDHLHANRYGSWRMGLYIASQILGTPFATPRTSFASLSLVMDATLSGNPTDWGVSPYGDLFKGAAALTPPTWDRIVFNPGVRSIEYTSARGTLTNTSMFAIFGANSTHAAAVSEAPTTAKFGRWIVGAAFDNYTSLTLSNSPIKRRIKVSRVGSAITMSSSDSKGGTFLSHYTVPNATTDAAAQVKAITDVSSVLGMVVVATVETAYPTPYMYDVWINDVPILDVIASGVLPA